MKTLHREYRYYPDIMAMLTRSVSSLFLALTVSLSITHTVMADDTEIYTGSATFSSRVLPNLTFIIDTSGSMDTDVVMTVGTYDPGTTYVGTCDPTRIYWSSKGNAPDCSTSDYIDATSYTCKSAETALATGGDGFYVTRAARYKPGTSGGKGKWGSSGEDRWSSLSSSNHTDLVECKDDFGVHGETDVSTDLYPADENDGGPWRADDTKAINWNNTGNTYTFYNANYLNWRSSPGVTVTKTRLQIVQEVFSDLMDSITNINVAVMRYDDGGQGGYFVKEMEPLTDANKADYQAVVNDFTANGSTPLAETLYEAYLYYKGDSVKYGDSSSPATNVSEVLDTADTSKYASPIEFQCQKNFVILLTDGDPTSDTDADNDIESLSGFKAVTGSNSCSGDCLDELAQYMYMKDCSSLDDTQNVVTYTIGFNTAQTLLNDAATKGGGKYYTADDTAELTDVFTSILTEILAINTTFIAPAVSVNAFNRFNHRNELYYALFRPNARPKWYGNVKRFQLEGDPPIIVDVNGDPAIDNNTGFFKSTSTSYWTPAADAPDGDEVKKGGAASKLALPRTFYTYTGASAPNDEPLTDAANAFDESNAAITKTMLGDATMTDAARTSIIQWARGVDIFDEDSDGDDTDIRRFMADPLHAKPVLITYGGTDADPDITLFAGTNGGELMAINTTTGAEVFTFMPQELMSNLPILFENAGTSSHPYGLDGPLTSGVNDANGNGILYDNATSTLETGEFAYLYQGMRRGGKNYYAFDVTDRGAPLLKWMIQGGTGTFNELAMTWSSANYGKIKVNGVEKKVLFFGGGYDAAQDDKATTSNDTEGRAIYIVDAETGAKIWQAGKSGTGDSTGANPNLTISTMTNSIPADITVLDIDGDGYKDRIYAADMAGQIFRIDLDNANTGVSSLATGGRIAQLGDNTAAGNRRFYYAPDVSLSKDRSHLNIALGSGFRAHPLNTDVHDAFFVIHDYNVDGPAVDGSGNPVYTTLTLSDLYDATSNIIAEGTAAEIATAQAELAASQGFYIWMNESDGSFAGEKVLAKSLTYSDKVIFTTYKPVADGTGACSPSQGSASAYLISLDDGTPVRDSNLSGGEYTRDDRRINLVRGGIPPEPSIIFHENGPVVLIGTEKGPDPDILVSPKKIYWHVE